jgi:FtsZ-binding cell division protein ZapB
MNPPEQPTPRTDAIDTYIRTRNDYTKTDHEVWREHARTLERELTETERQRFGADADRRRLRAEVERWKTVAAQMTAEREHNANEASRLRAENERLKTCGIVEIAASNSSVLDYCKHWEARAEKAEAELADWSVLNLWGGTPEIIHEFVKGQQTRIHRCQDLEAELTALAAERDQIRAEADRLNDIINRAGVQFFHDGTDGQTAAKMLTVLNETKLLKNETPTP